MNPNCIAAVSAAAGREITAQEALDLEGRIVAAMRVLARADREKWAALPADQRLQEASRYVAREIQAETARKQQRTVRDAQIAATLDSYIADAKTRGIDGLDAVQRSLMNKPDGKSRGTAVDMETHAVAAHYMGALWETFEATEPRLFGLMANEKGIVALTKELAGEHSGSEIAKRGAEIMQRTFETMRQRFNDNGGAIGRLDNYRTPQVWAQERVFKAGFETFASDFMRWADRGMYVDETGALFDDARMRSFLEEAGKTIASGGMNKIDPSGAGLGSLMVANRGREHRQLHFKDAASYLEAQAKYGRSTLEQVIAGHVMQMARDIALVEHFGSNPQQTVRYLALREAKAMADAGTGKNLEPRIRKIDNVYSYLAGARQPIASEWLARAGDSLRQWMIASRLGSSTITALVDESTLMLTARVNAVSYRRTFLNEIAQTDPKFRERLRGGRLGLESMISEMNRWGTESLGKSFASKMAQTTMRLNGLDALDAVRRSGIGATIYDALGRLTHEHERLADLDRSDIGVLDTKGVTQRHWDVWRRAETSDWGYGNSHVLEPDAIMRIPDEKLADLVAQQHGPAAAQDPAALARYARMLRDEATTKLLAHVLEEGSMAVPSPGTREQLIAGSGLQRGTLSGELYRSLMLFKSFPLAMISKHWMRGMNMPTAGGRALYIAQLMVGTTILGMLKVEIDNILAGKDPQRLFGEGVSTMESVKNIVRGFLAGGSMGMYGDFLFSSISKNGQNDLFGTLGGPALGLVQEAMNLGQGGLIRELEGRNMRDIGAHATAFVKGLAPAPLSTLWYTKAAMDHILWQQVAEYLSPGYLSRMQTRAARDYHETFWWKPGAGLEFARAPDLTRIAGE